MKLSKKTSKFKLMSLLFISMAGFTSPVFAANDNIQKMGTTADKSLATEQIIQAFAQASDRSDAEALEQILHPDFRVVFTMKAGTSPTTLSRAQYIQMVRDGKIGGKPRKVELSGFSSSNSFATTKATMTRPDAVFTGVYSLIEQDGRWLLLQEAVLMSVKEMKK
jgi:ketosteroid isomerase-like protein